MIPTSSQSSSPTRIPGPALTVLVQGAGIAGLTLAYWLQRRGCRAVVVERAAAPRRGGQAVDVRGPALQVVDLMGAGDRLRSARTRMRGMSVVDPDDGRELVRSTAATLTGGPLDSPDVEILRDDLADLLLAAVREDAAAAVAPAELRWGTRIVTLEQDDHGVTAGLDDGERIRADLVVGADGLHSGIRSLVVPAAEVGTHDLGTHLAVFTMPNVFGLHEWQVFAARSALMCGVYTARQDTEVRVTMGFAGQGGYRHDDPAAQREALADAYRDFGWWAPRMLAGMAQAPDFYLAPMVQVLLERWSWGRVALLGDAAWCTTPLSGQGTSLALVGAYVLAGDLATHPGGTGAALASWEQRMRPFVTANQQLALVNEQRSRAAFGLDDGPGGPDGPGAGAGQGTVTGIEQHWVASAASAVELPRYPDGVAAGPARPLP